MQLAAAVHARDSSQIYTPVDGRYVTANLLAYNHHAQK